MYTHAPAPIMSKNLNAYHTATYVPILIFKGKSMHLSRFWTGADMHPSP